MKSQWEMLLTKYFLILLDGEKKVFILN